MLAVLAVAATALLVTWSPARGDLQQRIRAQESQEDRLEAAVARETQRIEAANDGLAQAQARLAELSARLDARRAELEEVQRELVDARDRLTRLENRYRRAAGALAENLRTGYMNGSPDLVTVMLDSQGFSEIGRASCRERVSFLV